MSARTMAPSAAVRDVDVRGFVYSLEPVRQQQQWRLDKSMAELAQAQQVLAGTEAVSYTHLTLPTIYSV